MLDCHRLHRHMCSKNVNLMPIDPYQVVPWWWLSLLHNFIQLSLNLGSAQVQILLAACRRFAMVMIADKGPGWK